jgi:large subunit ribosomal protein L31e
MTAEETETEEELAEEEETVEEAEEAEEAEEIKEEEKPAPEERREEEEEDIVEERIYTVPLGRAWIGPRRKHSPRAIRLLRGFIVRHMKADEDSIRITNEVNEKIWSRGIEKPPRKVRIRATRDTEGIVTVRVAEGD